MPYFCSNFMMFCSSKGETSFLISRAWKIQSLDAAHGVKDHILRNGVGDMLHVGTGCRLDECIVKRGTFERNIHLRQRDRRTEGDEEASQFACLFFLTIQHELNQRTVGDEVAVQIIALDMLKMLQAIADGVRQRTVIAVIRHQRNQTAERMTLRAHISIAAPASWRSTSESASRPNFKMGS